MVEEEGPNPETLTQDVPAWLLAPGQVLGGRFQVRALLGRGGMGEVWVAFDLKLRVEVALKALHWVPVQDERRRELLRREVRAAREVISPNVCRVFDLVEVGGRELVSMEYVDGQTLLRVLQERGPLELKEAQDIASQFLAGLEAIHRVGLVHRDVKPENIMLTRAGRVVVMDLGLAKEAQDGAGSVSGTPAYMAPEQVAGLKVDARADVYSAGVVLAEMVRPGGIKDVQSRQRVWEGVHSEPAQLPDSPWAPVLRKAVARDPAQRYGSASELIRALENVTQRVEGAEDLHPYPGLASFAETDAEYFFGREAEVEQMWRRLGGPARLLALVGPSGSGKTSFLRAGLIPSAPTGWRVARCTPGGSPFVALRELLADEMSGDADAVRLLLRGDDLHALVSVAASWRRRYSRVLLVVDQFEELFTHDPVDTRARFADLVVQFALDADVHVLLSMRDDFLMRCNEHEELAPIFSELTPLKPLAGTALRRALVQPATKCGYRFEDEHLVEEMLAEVEGERGALPLLAFAAARLWEARDRENGLLSRQAYHDVGGVGGALARHAEATMDRIGANRVPVVRELFRNLVTAEGTRAVRGWDELLSVFPETEHEAAETALWELVDARLLTSYELREEEAEPVRRVEIVHESLLTNWPRLVRWQVQDTEGALLRDQLRQAARTWAEHARSSDLLWTGSTFREYRVWRERYPGGLSELEEAFARAMTALATRRRRRRRLAVAAAFVMLLSVLGIVGVSRQQAIAEARRAEAAKLLALGRLELDADPTAALAYGRASLEVYDTPEVRRFTLEALWKGPVAAILPLPSVPSGYLLDFSPRGDRLAVAGFTEDALVYLADGGEPLVVSGHSVSPRGLRARFASDSILVTGHPVAEKLWVWSLPEGRKLRGIDLGADGSFWTVRGGPLLTFRLEPADRGVGERLAVRSWIVPESTPSRAWHVPVTDLADLDIDQMGGRVVYSTSHGEIRLRRLDDALGESTVLAAGLGGAVRIVLRPLHAEVLAASGGDYGLWPLGHVDREPLQVLHGGEKSSPMIFDPGGRWFLAFERGLARAQLWDLDGPPDADPSLLRAANLFWAQGGAAFDPTGRWLATSHAGKVAFWPLGEPHSRLLASDVGRIGSLAFSPSGDTLISVSMEKPLRIWPMSPLVGRAPRDALLGVAANAAAVDPAGSTAIVATTGRGILFVPLAGGETRRDDAFSPDSAVTAVSFDATGRWAAAAPFFSRDDMKIVVWDRANSARCEIPLRDSDGGDGYQGRVNGLAFAPDGALYSAGFGGVRRWDVASGRAETLLEGADADMGLSSDGLVLAAVVGSAMLDDDGASTRLVVLDLQDGTSREVTTHGSRVFSVALDATGTVLVTAGHDRVIRVGTAAGGEPHLLLGHRGLVTALTVSPDGRWIASGGADGTIHLWAMPDLSQPPLQSLPHDQLLAKLDPLTNLRVVRDSSTETGWKLDIGPFPGWAAVPEWNP